MTVTVTLPGTVAGPDAPVVDTRPENVPEKFWNAETKAVNTEALLASYTELEKRQSTAAKPAATPAEQDTPPADTKPEGTPPAETADTPEQEAAKAAAAAAGVDYAALNTKYQTNGALEDSDYATLEAKGIPRDMVDAYIAGQEALATNARNAILVSVGGEEGFTAMSAWASENLPASELAAYNAIVDGDNPDAVKLALENLHAKFKAGSTKEPTLLSGQAASAVDVYNSAEEMKADMRKPEYKKDPAFRAKVSAKLARSSKV